MNGRVIEPGNQTTQFSFSQAKGGFTSVVNVQLPSQRIRESAKLHESRFQTPFRAEEEKKTEEVEDTKEDETMHALQEQLVGKGVGFALKIFRERGMLGQIEAIGRNKEKTIEQQLSLFSDKKNQDDDMVKIKYLDKKGHELKGKEAFRQMCWKFHGKMPSHRKQEKRRVKEELETKQMRISVGLNPKLLVGNKPEAKKAPGNLGSLSKKVKKI